MIIKPTDFCITGQEKFDDIRLAVGQTCVDLGIKGNLQLMTMWKIPVSLEDEQSFVDLVKENLSRN